MTEAAIPPTEKILVEHATFVRELCRGMLRDEHLAEDVAQETLAAGLSRRGGPLRNPRGWLAAVARNLTRRAHRTAARRDRRERAAARPEAVLSAARSAARLEAQHRVVAAVRGLSEPARSTVILRYLDGLGPGEIARRVGIPVRTVESRLRRALAELRRQLAGEDPRSHRLGLILLAGGPGSREVAHGWAALSGGVLIMTLTKKLALAAAALLLLLGVLLTLPSGDETPGPAPVPRLVAAPGAPAIPQESAVVALEPEATPAPESDGKPTVIRGRLLGPDTRPRAGVEVRFVRRPRYRVEEQGAERAVVLEGARILRVLLGTFAVELGEDRAVTDENGAFELPVAGATEAGVLLFFEGPPGPSPYPDPSSILFFLPADSIQGGIVRMPATGTIHGRVVDADGNPKEGNVVACWPESVGLDVAAVRDRHGADFSTTAAPGGSFPSRNGMRMTRTDSEGRFDLAELPPGEYFVRAGRIQDASRGVRVREGLTTGPLDIRVGRPAPPLISGRVVDAQTGEPVVAGVSTTFTGETGGQGMTGGAKSTSDGRFELTHLPAGEHTLHVRAKGFVPGESGPYRLGPTGRVTDLEIRLRRKE